MSSFKSILVGIATAILAVVAWLAASVSIGMGEGASSATLFFNTGSLALAGLVGFVAGFWLHRLLVARRRS